MAAERGRMLAKAGLKFFAFLIALIGAIFLYFVLSSPEAAVNPPLMGALSAALLVLGLVFLFIGVE